MAGKLICTQNTRKTQLVVTRMVELIVTTNIFFSFNKVDLSRNMQVDYHMQWCRE